MKKGRREEGKKGRGGWKVRKRGRGGNNAAAVAAVAAAAACGGKPEGRVEYGVEGVVDERRELGRHYSRQTNQRLLF